MSHDLHSTLRAAADMYRLDKEGKPDLVKTGIAPVDHALGGLSPGSCAIVAAATSVGKSRTMLYMATHTDEPVGIISVEDPADVVGGRLLAQASGIDGLRIRKKDLSEGQLKTLMRFVENPPFPNIKYLGYPIAGKIDEVASEVEAAREAGCRLIILDYIQEIRGHNPTRKDEVIEALAACHRAAARGENPAAFVALSQFRRLEDPMKPPSIHHLKESGDLENKARVIILAHRALRSDGKTFAVRFRVGKSTYGGENLSFEMVTNQAGCLELAADDPAESVSW